MPAELDVAHPNHGTCSRGPSLTRLPDSAPQYYLRRLKRGSMTNNNNCCPKVFAPVIASAKAFSLPSLGLSLVHLGLLFLDPCKARANPIR